MLKTDKSKTKHSKPDKPKINKLNARRRIAGRIKNAVRRAAVISCIMALGCLLFWGCGKKEPDQTDIRIGSLKGPTSLGILFLMDRADKGETKDSYEFRMAVGADELLALMAKGELDIALVPANVAAVFYGKTEGGIAVIDINTLGVLSLVTGSDGISQVPDLEGKTIYLTGKGATPEASLRYILQQNGFTEADYALEYKSEAAEVAAVLAENPEAVGLLPQPFVTAALMQNENLQAVLDMNEEWERLQSAGGGMVTGVTIVRREFLEEHEDAVREFLKEHQESVRAVNGDPEAGGTLAAAAGIVAKEEIAAKAIPQCHIVCITGDEMREKLQGYLKVLEAFDRELVGGKLPGEDFYYEVP